MFRKRPPRLRTFSYVGLHRYFATMCTDLRRPHFISAHVVECILSQILRAACDQGFAVLAYCFMPDHVHLLAEGTRDDADFVRFMSRAKQFSGFAFSRSLGRPLWQEGTYERVLRSEESTAAVARYIFENPIRAGLAVTIDQYAFSGSDVYTMEHFAELFQRDGTTWRPDRRG
jgi:putative transposase